MMVQIVNLDFEFLFPYQFIDSETTDIVPASYLESIVSAKRNTPVLLETVEYKSLVVEFFYDRLMRSLRAVIDDNTFPILERLVVNVFQAIPQQIGIVQYGNTDGDSGHQTSKVSPPAFAGGSII